MVGNFEYSDNPVIAFIEFMVLVIMLVFFIYSSVAYKDKSIIGKHLNVSTTQVQNLINVTDAIKVTYIDKNNVKHVGMLIIDKGSNVKVKKVRVATYGTEEILQVIPDMK